MHYSIYFSIIFGIMIIALAEFFIIVFGHHQSIFVMVNKVINGFGSPLLVVVVLGMIKRRPSADSVFWGVILGAIFSLSTEFMLEYLALHYYAVLNLLATLAFCYGMELIRYLIRKKTI